MTSRVARLNRALEGRYHIERKVGEGGSATVYLAHDLRHDRQVALKVFAPHVAAAVGPARFLEEIRTTANLQHPNILPLYDSGEADGILYYVMPFVEGETLGRRMDDEGQLPVSEVVEIAVEICDALDSAHDQGVVHRDIKPDNILMSRGRPVLADFGIALALSAAADDRLTGAGMHPGTPRYMSPEQASEESVDGRADLYALGCVIYEALTGDPPFPGSRPEAILARKVTEPVRSIRTVRPTVPAALEEVILRVLAASPADRYQTAGDFARALAGATTSRQERRPAPVRTRALLLTLSLALAAIGIWAVGRSGLGGAASGPEGGVRTAIAVLPFDNLSGEGPYAYFASALYVELLTQLQRVDALTVIGERSVTDFVTAGRPMDQLGEALGVGSVVEASVQVAGDRLHWNVQLSDAVTDTLLWAESYDETLDDAFAVQSRIVRRVADELGAEVTSAEESVMAEAPTTDPEAYRFYLQGLDYLRRPSFLRQNLEIAQQQFQQAIELDSGFAMAYARLAEVHGDFYNFRLDPSAERAEALRDAAEAALRMEPESPFAHYAMALWNMWGRRDYRSALEQFDVALTGLPDNPDIWQLRAAAHRHLGEYGDALADYERSVELDPRDADNIYDLGGVTYWVTHQYDNALSSYDRALSLAPDHRAAAVDRAWIYFFQGEGDTVRALLDRLPVGQPLGYHLGTARRELVRLLFLDRRTDSLLSLVSGSGPGIMANQVEYLPSALYAAWALQLRGADVAATGRFEQALTSLDSALAGRPDDWRVRAARGLTLAGLGRGDEAVQEAGFLGRSPAFADGFLGTVVREYRARIYAQAGEVGPALEDLRRLLAGPSFYVTARTVRMSPIWDPLREDPRFGDLLAEFPVS